MKKYNFGRRWVAITKTVARVFVACALAASSTLTHAAWGNDVKIAMLDVMEGGTFVTADQNMGCGGPTRSFIPSTTGGYKEIVATLLTAYMSGKTINVFFTTCNFNGDALFNRVLIKN